PGPDGVGLAAAGGGVGHPHVAAGHPSGARRVSAVLERRPGEAAGRPATEGGHRVERRRLVRWLAGVWLVVTAVGLVGLHARADDVSRTTADEPQYLLSALSLWDDGDLDISDELAARAYEPFHEVALPEQT